MRIIFLSLFLISPLSFSANCENPRDDFDGLYCLNKIYIEADNELNAAYNSLKALLNTAQKAELKKVQLNWIKERNSACGMKQNGKFYVSLKCVTNMTVSQTNYLREKNRECKAVGCFSQKNNKLDASYPEEVDTISIGRSARITSIKGKIRAKNSNGTLSTIHEGYLFKKGQMLLVPKGASFKIGGNQFGPEHHGDRWIKLQ